MSNSSNIENTKIVPIGQIDIDPDIYGFNIADKFVVGYGLDDDKGHGRNLPYIAYVE